MNPPLPSVVSPTIDSTAGLPPSTRSQPTTALTRGSPIAESTLMSPPSEWPASAILVESIAAFASM
ncbi:MAG TPA: hypothetical protein VH143_00100 [Kofleriaceae bacterium]|nr:hypothetical protein [Kofleriaceae bacterium]